MSLKSIKDPLRFFTSTITDEFVNGLERAAGLSPRAGVFRAITTVWLVIAQRLSGRKTLSHALERLEKEAWDEVLSPDSGRARTKRFSANTSGFSQAKTRLELSVVEGVADALNDAMLKFHEDNAKKNERERIFVVDGTTVTVAHTKKNLARYPQSRNQHGKAHFPIIRVCVATDARTGISARPAYGAYNGEEAVSEITLAKSLLARLPAQSTVVGDRNFGCFQFAWAAQQLGHRSLCRMKVTNAASVLGFTPKGSGEHEVTWTPAPRESEKHSLPDDAAIPGRFVWCPLPTSEKTKQSLIIFTTSALPAKRYFGSTLCDGMSRPTYET